MADLDKDQTNNFGTAVLIGSNLRNRKWKYPDRRRSRVRPFVSPPHSTLENVGGRGLSGRADHRRMTPVRSRTARG